MLLGAGVGMVEAPSSAAVQVQLHPWAGALLLVVTSGGHISDGLGRLGLSRDWSLTSLFLLLLKIWVQRTVPSSYMDLSH